MIKIEGLSKQYNKKAWALQGVELQIEKGMFGLLGPNGAGKTTLMRIVATLLQPSAGIVNVNGQSLSRPERIRGMIGYLPQFFQIYPQLTGIEFLDYVGVMKGLVDPAGRKRQIHELLERVNLSAYAGQKVKTYSGGMKQRLGIAQALLGQPEVLIVDEPTAGLDPEERVRFRNVLAQFSLQRTVILSTHIVADIESSCRRVAVLDRGIVALAGDLERLQAYAADKVWEMDLDERDLASFAAHEIVSSRRSERGIVCRIIAGSRPGPYAVPLAPTLEDGYLALIGGERA